MTEFRARALQRVVYLCEFSTLLGGERSMLAFLDGRGASVDPLVVCPNTGPLCDEIDRRRIARLGWRGSAKSTWRSIISELTRRQPDIVHGNSLSLAGVTASMARQLNIPGVLHVRDISRISGSQRDALNSMSAVVGVSQAVCGHLRDAGVSPERIRCIYNGVEPIPRVPRAPAGRARIACIGQIALRKGQDLFLEACKRVVDAGHDVEIWILGERYSAKEESVEFERQLRACGDSPPLSGRVHWLGYQSDMERVYGETDLVVVPSRQEPLSRVLLESVAASVRAVATDVGGSQEIARHSPTIRLVPADSAAALAEGIVQSLDELSAAGPLKVRIPSRFSTRVHGGLISRLYESIRPV